MSNRPPNRIEKALVDLDEKGAALFAHVGRAFEQATIAMENLRLAIPTEDIKHIRQTATDSIDRAMR